MLHVARHGAPGDEADLCKKGRQPNQGVGGGKNRTAPRNETQHVSDPDVKFGGSYFNDFTDNSNNMNLINKSGSFADSSSKKIKEEEYADKALSSDKTDGKEHQMGQHYGKKKHEFNSSRPMAGAADQEDESIMPRPAVPTQADAGCSNIDGEVNASGTSSEKQRAEAMGMNQASKLHKNPGRPHNISEHGLNM